MITSIRTNIKAYEGATDGSTVELRMGLALRTAVVDEWTRGKTRWLRAVEFAMTARLPGVSRPKEMVETWGPPNATRLFAELVLSDGSMYTASVDKGESGWVLSHTMPDAVRALPEAARARALPLRAAREVVTKGADLGRRELILRFGEGASAAPPEKLAAEDRKLWSVAVEAGTKALLADKKRTLSGPPDAAELLVWLQAEFGSEQVATKKQITALEARLAQAVPAVAGVEQVPQLKAQLVKAQRWESAASVRTRRTAAEASRQQYLTAQGAYQAQIDTWNSQAGARAALRVEHEALVETTRQASAACAQDLEMQEEFLANGRAYIAGIDAALNVVRQSGAPVHEHTQGACTLCGATERPLMQIRMALGARVEARAKLVAEARAALRESQAKVAQAESQLSGFDAQVAQAEAGARTYMEQLAQAVAHVEQSIRELDQMASEMDATEDYEGPSSADLRAKLDALAASVAAREAYEAQLAEVEAKKKQHETFTRLKGAAREALVGLVDAAAARAEAAVAHRVPKGKKPRFNREDYCWEIYSERDQRWHTEVTACGDEATWLILGVAMAYTEGAPHRVVLLDAADLGEMNPAGLLAFEGYDDIQVLMAWTRRADVPPSWLCVNALGQPWPTATVPPDAAVHFYAPPPDAPAPAPTAAFAPAEPAPPAPAPAPVPVPAPAEPVAPAAFAFQFLPV